MKRVALSTGLLAATLLATAAGAQLADLDHLKHTTPEQRADFLTQTMKSDLTLTEAQLPKVQALNLKYAKLQQPVLDEQNSLFSQVRQIRAFNTQKEAELEPLLSAEQWKTYEAKRSDIKQKFESWAATQAADKQP